MNRVMDLVHGLRRRGRIAAILSALISMTFLMLLAAQPLLAAEETPKPVEGPVGTFYKWLNFAIVFLALAYLLVKKAPPYFRGRAEMIAAAITESTRVREQAEQQRGDAEAKLAGLDREIAELRAASLKDAMAETERLRQGARDEAGKIDRVARAEIQAAERSARLELKTIAARLAVERAEALLRTEMSPEGEASLFRDFLSDLSGRAN